MRGRSNQAMLRTLGGRTGTQIQRQGDASGLATTVPAYRDCTESITGISDANEKLDAARIRARDFVQGAIAALGKTPTAGSTLDIALGRHFVNPTVDQRAAISDTYGQILRELRVRNFICNTAHMCDGFQAFWEENDNLIHVCPGFWPLSTNCRAILLIHEAAHDVGISITGAHPFGRGTGTYPAGNNPPPEGETAVTRIANPDAYGFFAAHIWRGTDTGSSCR